MCNGLHTPARTTEPHARECGALFLARRPCEAKQVKRVSVCLALSGLIALLPVDGHAYCRQYSCQDDPEEGYYCERDERECIIEGNRLFYSTQCLSYTVARGHGERLGLSDQDFERLVGEAFERWTSVDCGDGRSPGLVVQSAGVVDVDEPFYCGQVELNTSVWLLVSDWSHDRDALGFTTSTYAADDAEIFDADVELNVNKVLVELPSEEVEQALISIMVHEAGHFLGLAHSDDPSAVMYEAYNRRDLVTRMLTQDDIDGICDAFPPDDAPTECSTPAVSEAAIDELACQAALEPPHETTCGVSAPGGSGAPSRHHAWWLLGVVFALAGRRRRCG